MSGTEVKDTELFWEGKNPNLQRIVLPFQIVETVNEPRKLAMTPYMENQNANKWYNKLIWGDNKFREFGNIFVIHEPRYWMAERSL